MSALRLKISDKLELIQLRPKDAEAAFALVNANREYLREWLPWVDTTKSVEDELAFIENGNLQAAKTKAFNFGIWHNKKLVGAISFHDLKERDQHISLGYWLSEDATGHGIMTECVKKMIEYSFRELHVNKVVIRTAVQNKKSRAVIERLGLRLDGVLRQEEKVGDRFYDLCTYSILASEWNG
jgi:ribosomal-protein-serine acetyltransferase